MSVVTSTSFFFIYTILRLAYGVIDNKIVLMVLSVGKRENNAVYDKIAKRMGK